MADYDDPIVQDIRISVAAAVQLARKRNAVTFEDAKMCAGIAQMRIRGIEGADAPEYSDEVRDVARVYNEVLRNIYKEASFTSDKPPGKDVLEKLRDYREEAVKVAQKALDVPEGELERNFDDVYFGLQISRASTVVDQLISDANTVRRLGYRSKREQAYMEENNKRRAEKARELIGLYDLDAPAESFDGIGLLSHKEVMDLQRGDEVERFFRSMRKRAKLKLSRKARRIRQGLIKYPG